LKSLFALFFLTSSGFLLTSSAFAACDSGDIVVNGASLGALSADGRPLFTIVGVGDITIRRHGKTVHLIEECDPVASRAIRGDLTAKLDGSEGGTRYETPAWLLY